MRKVSQLLKKGKNKPVRTSRIKRILAFLLFLTLFVCQKKPPIEDPNRSAVYTPYHLTPGGGERVVLTFLQKIQYFTGHHVDVIVDPGNVCARVTCLQNLAELLDVEGIDWTKVSVIPLRAAQKSYSLWWSMGNELFPKTHNRGILGIYHCQFPFDGRSGDVKHLKTLSSYDFVYLNSEYTNHWYHVYLRDYEENGRTELPKVVHFPPSFAPPTKSVESLPIFKDVVHIVLLGRIFEGTQGKHHMLAIDAFEMIAHNFKVKKELRLTLIGHVATGQQKYYRTVKQRAAQVDGVTLVDNATHDMLIGVLKSAHIVWSLTGMDRTMQETFKLHPADAEHFGLGLLQCMSMGIIPVATNRGGPKEILRGFPSYLSVSSIEDISIATQRIITSSEDAIIKLQKQSKDRAGYFASLFDTQLRSLFTIFGREMNPSNVQNWLTLYAQVKLEERRSSNPSMLQGKIRCPSEEKYAVVYVEERFDNTLQAVVKNLFSKLHDDWKLHAFVADTNKGLVVQSLSQFPCTIVHDLQDYVGNVGGLDPRQEGVYQNFWKSQAFWSTFPSSVEKVLTIQADAWFPVAGNFDRNWLSYDYVGAPWCYEGNWGYLETKDRPVEANKMLHDTRPLPRAVRVGNGGISIRSVSASKHIIETYGKLSPQQENEDVFFALHFNKYFKVPLKEEASRFSLEILCPDIEGHENVLQVLKSKSEPLRNPPFAVHKPFDVMDVLLANGVKIERVMQLLFSV